MNRRLSRNSFGSYRLALPALLVVLFVSTVMVTSLLAQGAPASSGASQTQSAASVAPNWDLASRWSVAKIGKLVFDTTVTPHWFELSDRFWYSYETPEGMRYWLVDPARKSKTPLFDNAKVAAQLSLLTGLPYDSQHLAIRNLKLAKKDTVLTFDAQVSKDAVIPNEEKKAETTTDETNQEENQTQVQGGRGQGGRRGGAAGTGAPPTENTRTIYFELDLATGKVTRLDKFDPPPARPRWASSISPDGKTIVFARGFNLYMMDQDNYKKARKTPGDASVVETQLTTDGEDHYSYARVLLDEEQQMLRRDQRNDKNKAGPRTPSIGIQWSKDSKKFSTTRADERKVADLWVIHTLANPRPTLETYRYAMPGEENVPQFDVYVFDVATKQRVTIQAASFKDQTVQVSTDRITNKMREEQQENIGVGGGGGMGMFGGITQVWLADTSDKLYFERTSRDLHRVDVCVADTATGTSKTLIKERANVFIDVKPLRQINNDAELFWWSERDGWGHYYLYDGAGTLKNQITSGEYMTDAIVSIDDKGRVLYFTANGRESQEDPYYDHLYRVNFDGTGMKLLTPGNFSHAAAAPDDGKYFIDTYSRVDTAPKSVLLDNQGAPVAELETTDIHRLLEAGFKFPEPFHVKADDGITDIYGEMYKPFDFDPNRKYPLIEYVYPGPQTESVNKTFTPRSASIALANLGIVVIEVGNRGGNPNRDLWYETFGYGNLRDYGLADKKAAAEQLAAEHPYIDINRVGIWGHSGGGFMSAAAILEYPDFFKVAWSESGNHENNVYNKYWSEKYDGVKEETEKDGTVKFLYNIDKNSELAKNLKGHLMLTTGDMDNNVHMANTMRLADALIRAGKRFDMFVLPGQRHAYGPDADYITWARMNYFSRWLLGSGQDGADMLELQRERANTGDTAGRGGRGGTGTTPPPPPPDGDQCCNK
jgi:dipeptidyl aminopeptidase/acylaminoacyl peptidase